MQFDETCSTFFAIRMHRSDRNTSWDRVEHRAVASNNETSDESNWSEINIRRDHHRPSNQRRANDEARRESTVRDWRNSNHHHRWLNEANTSEKEKCSVEEDLHRSNSHIDEHLRWATQANEVEESITAEGQRSIDRSVSVELLRMATDETISSFWSFRPGLTSPLDFVGLLQRTIEREIPFPTIEVPLDGPTGSNSKGSSSNAWHICFEWLIEQDCREANERVLPIVHRWCEANEANEGERMIPDEDDRDIPSGNNWSLRREFESSGKTREESRKTKDSDESEDECQLRSIEWIDSSRRSCAVRNDHRNTRTVRTKSLQEDLRFHSAVLSTLDFVVAFSPTGVFPERWANVYVIPSRVGEFNRMKSSYIHSLCNSNKQIKWEEEDDVVSCSHWPNQRPTGCVYFVYHQKVGYVRSGENGQDNSQSTGKRRIISIETDSNCTTTDGTDQMITD